MTADLHIDIQRTGQLLFGDTALNRAHDHVMLLDRRKTIHTLVVGERLVITRDDTGSFAEIDAELEASGEIQLFPAAAEARLTATAVHSLESI